MLWLLFTGIALAEPVAMVTDASQGVSVLDGGKTTKLALLDYLEPGMTLRLDAGASLSVTFFAKSVEYRFSGPARLTVQQDRLAVSEGKPEVHAVSLNQAATARKYTLAQRESVAQAVYEMRAVRPGLRLEDPVDTRVIGDDVVLGWDGPQSAGGYQLSLYDASKQLLHQVSLNDRSWMPPAGLLKAGGSYEWEVRASLGNGEVLTARGSFSVADSAAAGMARKQQPSANASFSERVLYALQLEEEGFRYDARRIWKVLAKERPDDTVVRERSVR